jgi:hypothetical protein
MKSGNRLPEIPLDVNCLSLNYCSIQESFPGSEIVKRVIFSQFTTFCIRGQFLNIKNSYLESLRVMS